MENSNQGKDEFLRTENDILKMKLMLEHGAQFGEGGEGEMTAEMENEFLKYVAEFEKQFQQCKRVSIFEKIGRPGHFKPVGEIPDDAINSSWEELHAYMVDRGIDLDACSPNVSKRELYRFATEEFFKQEVDDINMEGFTFGFIYDEYYPDPVYDNSQLVVQWLIHDIFRKEGLFGKIHYARSGLEFNGRAYAGFEEFNRDVDRFKNSFESIEVENAAVVNCVVEKEECLVTGTYKARAITGSVVLVFEGNFTVELFVEEECWYMKRIWLDGFELGNRE